MMSVEQDRLNASTMNRIAQGQSIGGKNAVIGQGMVPRDSKFDPFRIIDNVPIFYSGYNIVPTDIPPFSIKTTHKWGEYYDPGMMPGMPDIGGWNKLYIDTRIKGAYILWCSTKLDEWANGPSDWSTDVLAWTPKSKNDSIPRAGYRMFWTAALNGDFVDKDDFYSTLYEDDDWNKEWTCSIRCKQVFASIRATLYENDREFDEVLTGAPEFLKPHINSRRLII